MNLCPLCGSPHEGRCPKQADYNAALAEQTKKRYDKRHVVPLTGGGSDPFIYWTSDERGPVGLIRGSYTREKLPA